MKGVTYTAIELMSNFLTKHQHLCCVLAENLLINTVCLCKRNALRKCPTHLLSK